LPDVRPSIGEFGTTRPDVLGGHAVPVAGIAGDQQAALYGQACLDPGLGKNTYGTGSFVLLNAGEEPPPAPPGLLATVAWGIGERTSYALEAAIFVTGAAVQWLRDGLGIIERADETEGLAASLESMAYQAVDAIQAMEAAGGEPLQELKADGGATVNRWLMQFQADVLGVPVVLPEVAETTAVGAAYLAGVATGAWTLE